jgi:hypothetical protein
LQPADANDRRGRANLGRTPEQLSADSGYCSEPNLARWKAGISDGGRAQDAVAAKSEVADEASTIATTPPQPAGYFLGVYIMFTYSLRRLAYLRATILSDRDGALEIALRELLELREQVRTAELAASRSQPSPKSFPGQKIIHDIGQVAHKPVAAGRRSNAKRKV